MSDLEDRLELALRAEAAPARDPAFRVETVLRHEKALFRRQLLACCALAAGAILLALLGGLFGEPPAVLALQAALAAAAGFLAARHTGKIAGLMAAAGLRRSGTPALTPRLWR